MATSTYEATAIAVTVRTVYIGVNAEVIVHSLPSSRIQPTTHILLGCILMNNKLATTLCFGTHSNLAEWSTAMSCEDKARKPHWNCQSEWFDNSFFHHVPDHSAMATRGGSRNFFEEGTHPNSSWLLAAS